MAAAGSFDMVVLGRGGHAAAPHQTSDPILATAALVQALQQVSTPTGAGLAACEHSHLPVCF